MIESTSFLHPLTLIWYLTFPAKCWMTKAGSLTGVETKYLFPWCCCLNLANNVSSVAWGKLGEEERKRRWVTDDIKKKTEMISLFITEKQGRKGMAFLTCLRRPYWLLPWQRGSKLGQFYLFFKSELVWLKMQQNNITSYHKFLKISFWGAGPPLKDWLLIKGVSSICSAINRKKMKNTIGAPKISTFWSVIIIYKFKY